MGAAKEETSGEVVAQHHQNGSCQGEAVPHGDGVSAVEQVGGKQPAQPGIAWKDREQGGQPVQLAPIGGPSDQQQGGSGAKGEQDRQQQDGQQGGGIGGQVGVPADAEELELVHPLQQAQQAGP